MTKRERQTWTTLAALVVVVFVVTGSGIYTVGVFVSPLIKTFGWDRAQVSVIWAGFAFSAALSAPIVGWLLDRIKAQRVMIVGVVITAAAFFVASRAHSYSIVILAYAMTGVGLASSSLLPTQVIVVNWFGLRRGLAMGLTAAGGSVGGTAMTFLTNGVIVLYGWRAGYLSMAIPIAVIVLPVAIFIIRSRPEDSQTQKLTVPEQALALPGLEVREALRNRSFWLIWIAFFLYEWIGSAYVVHFVPYVIGLGYRAKFAGELLAVAALLSTLGKIWMGILADRHSPRLVMGVNLAGYALGIAFLFGARNPVFLALFIVVFGFCLGAPPSLVPLMIIESLGVKRFGSLAGLVGMSNTLGAAIGVIVTGWLFDRTGSYTVSFELLFLFAVISTVATLLCRPLESEPARSTRIAAA